MEAVAEKKEKEKHFTAAFIFIVAVHARSAAVLTEPLCKLQSEAGLGLLAYSLGEVVRKEEKTDLRFANMETAEIELLMPVYKYIHMKRYTVCFIFCIRSCTRNM